jgi:hypothetical protein
MHWARARSDPHELPRASIAPAPGGLDHPAVHADVAARTLQIGTADELSKGRVCAAVAIPQQLT